MLRDGRMKGELRVRAVPGREMTGYGRLAVDGRYKAYGQELRVTRGNLVFNNGPVSDPVLDVRAEDFFARAATPEGMVTELPGGRSVLVRYFPLPNGGSVATHLDCTDQRKLSRKLASTTQFLESVLDNVPVCVAAKNIEDGRYIFANRAFERFSRFSRDHIVGKRADEIFRPETAVSIDTAAA